MAKSQVTQVNIYIRDLVRLRKLKETSGVPMVKLLTKAIDLLEEQYLEKTGESK